MTYEIEFYSSETGVESCGVRADWSGVAAEVAWLFRSFGDEPGFTVYVEPVELPWYCDPLELHSAAELPAEPPW